MSANETSLVLQLCCKDIVSISNKGGRHWTADDKEKLGIIKDLATKILDREQASSDSQKPSLLECNYARAILLFHRLKTDPKEGRYADIATLLNVMTGSDPLALLDDLTIRYDEIQAILTEPTLNIDKIKRLITAFDVFRFDPVKEMEANVYFNVKIFPIVRARPELMDVLLLSPTILGYIGDEFSIPVAMMALFVREHRSDSTKATLTSEFTLARADIELADQRTKPMQALHQLQTWAIDSNSELRQQANQYLESIKDNTTILHRLLGHVNSKDDFMLCRKTFLDDLFFNDNVVDATVTALNGISYPPSDEDLTFFHLKARVLNGEWDALKAMQQRAQDGDEEADAVIKKFKINENSRVRLLKNEATDISRLHSCLKAYPLLIFDIMWSKFEERGTVRKIYFKNYDSILKLYLPDVLKDNLKYLHKDEDNMFHFWYVQRLANYCEQQDPLPEGCAQQLYDVGIILLDRGQWFGKLLTDIAVAHGATDSKTYLDIYANVKKDGSEILNRLNSIKQYEMKNELQALLKSDPSIMNDIDKYASRFVVKRCCIELILPEHPEVIVEGIMAYLRVHDYKMTTRGFVADLYTRLQKMEIDDRAVKDKITLIGQAKPGEKLIEKELKIAQQKFKEGEDLTTKELSALVGQAVQAPAEQLAQDVLSYLMRERTPSTNGSSAHDDQPMTPEAVLLIKLILSSNAPIANKLKGYQFFNQTLRQAAVDTQLDKNALWQCAQESLEFAIEFYCNNKDLFDEQVREFASTGPVASSADAAVQELPENIKLVRSIFEGEPGEISILQGFSRGLLFLNALLKQKQSSSETLSEDSVKRVAGCGMAMLKGFGVNKQNAKTLHQLLMENLPKTTNTTIKFLKYLLGGKSYRSANFGDFSTDCKSEDNFSDLITAVKPTSVDTGFFKYVDYLSTLISELEKAIDQITTTPTVRSGPQPRGRSTSGDGL